jgi:hypothetical protein
MKHEWKKSEKQFYQPGAQPEFVTLPEFKYFTIEGNGNPNDPFFSEYIGVLYALSYGVKMSPKKGIEPAGYFDYIIYPLEGVWDLTEAGRKNYDGIINKDELVFKLMIRQPGFVTEDFAYQILEQTKKKKSHPLLEKVRFETITEGNCIQMLHLGSYDTEPESFRLMEAFAKENRLQRLSKTHREVYLSDARKTTPEKLKTILRFQVKQQ